MAKGIYKRGSIFWIRYVGLDKKMIFESTYSNKVRTAQALLIKRKQTIAEGREPEIKKIKNHTFKELAEEYIKWAEKQRSFKSKIYIINKLVDEFGSIALRRFNTMLVEQYQTKRLNEGKKPATANRYLATLSHMFTKAVDWNMAEEEISKKVKRVKHLQENNKRLRFLSQEECQNLIEVSDPHLKPILITALNTGMRKGEILGLRWSNVDMRHGLILLDITKNGERREIYINDTLRQTLQLIPRRLDINHVFFDKNTRNPYQDVKRSFARACKRAGIYDFRFHDMRHTFASQLVMAGVDLVTVKELLGHKSLAMTLRYSHLAPKHKMKAVKILDNKIRPKPIHQLRKCIE